MKKRFQKKKNKKNQVNPLPIKSKEENKKGIPLKQIN